MRTGLIFGGILLSVAVVSLLIFTFTIGGGHLTGPGIMLSLSVLALGQVGYLFFRAARALLPSAEDDLYEEKAAFGRRRKELEREYQAIKRALKELELDHSMGKLSEVDYGEIRSRYRERAVRILRQLDQGQDYRKQIDADIQARKAAKVGAKEADYIGAAARGKGKGAGKDPARASGERGRRHAPLGGIPETPAGPKGEALIARAVAPVMEAAGQAEATIPTVSAIDTPIDPEIQPTCARCGTRCDHDAAFCKRCGASLSRPGSKQQADPLAES